MAVVLADRTFGPLPGATKQHPAPQNAVLAVVLVLVPLPAQALVLVLVLVRQGYSAVFVSSFARNDQSQKRLVLGFDRPVLVLPNQQGCSCRRKYCGMNPARF